MFIPIYFPSTSHVCAIGTSSLPLHCTLLGIYLRKTDALLNIIFWRSPKTRRILQIVWIFINHRQIFFLQCTVHPLWGYIYPYPHSPHPLLSRGLRWRLTCVEQVHEIEGGGEGGRVGCGVGEEMDNVTQWWVAGLDENDRERECERERKRNLGKQDCRKGTVSRGNETVIKGHYHEETRMS